MDASFDRCANCTRYRSQITNCVSVSVVPRCFPNWIKIAFSSFRNAREVAFSMLVFHASEKPVVISRSTLFKNGKAENASFSAARCKISVSGKQPYPISVETV